MNLQLDQAWAHIQETGIPDFTTSVCPDYEFVLADARAIEWDKAFQEVEEGERAKLERQQKENERLSKQEQKKKEQENQAEI